MRLEGSIDITASARTVWDALVEPATLASCVPGVADVHQVDDRTFEGRVRASIGPIDGDFAFRSVLTRTEFPSDLVVDVEGTDSVTHSRVIAHVMSAVTDTTPGASSLRYTATVSAKGRLAIVGEMMLRATAGAMIGQVTRCLRARLETPAADPQGTGGHAETESVS